MGLAHTQDRPNDGRCRGNVGVDATISAGQHVLLVGGLGEVVHVNVGGIQVASGVDRSTEDVKGVGGILHEILSFDLVEVGMVRLDDELGTGEAGTELIMLAGHALGQTDGIVNGVVLGRVVQKTDATISRTVGMEAVGIDGNVELESVLADGCLEDGGRLTLADDFEEFLYFLTIVRSKVEMTGRKASGLANGGMWDESLDKK